MPFTSKHIYSLMLSACFVLKGLRVQMGVDGGP